MIRYTTDDTPPAPKKPAPAAKADTAKPAPAKEKAAKKPTPAETGDAKG